jgi:hypothetical protein
MPRIVWPQQPARIREAWLRHHPQLPAGCGDLLSSASPPRMSMPLAQAFLRCFYAARDLERAERDLGTGGEQTETFARKALTRRVEALEDRVASLVLALRSEACSPTSTE